MTCRHCHEPIRSHNRSEVCKRCRKRRAPDNRVVRLPSSFDVDRERRIEAYRERAAEQKPIFGG